MRLYRNLFKAEIGVVDGLEYFAIDETINDWNVEKLTISLLANFQKTLERINCVH